MIELNVQSNSKVFLVNYQKHFSLKQELLVRLETYKDVQNHSTNVKATMTEWNLNSYEIENLKSFVIDNLNNYYPFVNERNEKFYFANFWANIYKQNEYAIVHDHLFSMFSIIYFLKANKDDSPLIFTDSNISIIPKEGTVVIFPSHLKHQVSKQKLNQTRITLSGNINVEYQ